MIKNYFSFVFLFTFFLLNFLDAQNVALDFDGINDYVQTNYAGTTGNGARTIEAWIKTTKNSLPAGSGGAGQSVIADWGTFVTGGRFTFNVLWSNAIRLEVGGNGLSGTIAVNDGNWHHVAVSYNPTSTPNINLYVDGIRDVSGNVTVPVNTGTGNMRIGARIDGVNFFEGGIDEVRVYNIEKDSLSIYASMGEEFCGSLPAGLVSYFKLNEGIPDGNNSGNTLATDYVSNNTNALLGFSLSGTSSNWTNGPTLTGGSSSGNLSDAACSSYTSPSGNNTWTSSGSYMDTLVANNGCDSLLTIDLTILQSSDSISISNCGPYTAPSGQVFTSSGNYQDTLVAANASGCDSIIYINLLVGSNVSTIIDTSVCDEITIDNVLYTISTSVMDTVTTSAGCDSLLTYNITVNNSVTTTETISGCDSAEYNGTWYFTNQQFINASTTNSIPTCDSMHVVNVLVNQASTSSFDTIIACDSIMIEGTWYTESANLELLYGNAQGCDSMHLIDLTVESYDFDSVIVYDWWIIMPDRPGHLYDWYLCSDSSLISSDSIGRLKEYVINEWYYVVITNANCTFTSECYYIIGESINYLYNGEFILSPNPNTGIFNIDLGIENKAISYSILNIVGQEVAFKKIDSNSKFEVNQDLTAGMYLIMIETNNGKFANKFLVK